MAKALLLESDVAIVKSLLEDEEQWGQDPGEFARKILRALFANDSPKALSAVRGGIIAYGGPDCLWIVGPYATVDAAAKAAATSPMFGELRSLHPARMVHPHRYSDTATLKAA